MLEYARPAAAPPATVGATITARGGGRNTLIGGGGDDTLVGSGGADRIEGGGGNDRLDGMSGDDRITTASESDTVFGDYETIAPRHLCPACRHVDAIQSSGR